MIRRLASAAPLALLLAVAVPVAPAQAARTPSQAAAKPSAMMAAVQGVWQMTQANGQDTSAAGQEILITITDNKYVQSVNGQVVEKGTFKIDESKKPMTIDLSIVEGD